MCENRFPLHWCFRNSRPRRDTKLIADFVLVNSDWEILRIFWPSANRWLRGAKSFELGTLADIVATSADSFFEKNAGGAAVFSERGAREKIDPGDAKARDGVAPAKFPFRGSNSFALHQTLRRTRCAAFPKNPSRPIMHHLDRTCFIPDSDTRSQCANRSELGEVAQGHQTPETAWH